MLITTSAAENLKQIFSSDTRNSQLESRKSLELRHKATLKLALKENRYLAGEENL